MANLIITIISIALVAVAALMGAYYGGSAFLGGQQKALANAAVSGAKQVAAAWNLWSVEHAGERHLTYFGTDTVFEDNLVPKYLSNLPELAEAMFPPGSVAIRKKFVARCQFNINSSCSTGIDIIRLTITPELCVTIAKMAGGNSHTPPRVTAADYNITTVGKRPFDCLWHDENDDNVMDTPANPPNPTDDDYIMIYQP